MKKTFIALLLIIMIVFASCGKKVLDDEKHTEQEISDFIASYADEYTVIDGDGESKTILIEAPDFFYYIEVDDAKEEVLLDKLQTDIKNDKNPKMKEYTFQVDKVDDDTIKKGFLDRVSYDIFSSSINNLE